MNEYGYVGVFLLIALENLFPPIPSEIILTFGGFMTTQSVLSIGGVVVSSTLGSVVGAILLYGVGRLLDISRLEKLVDRYGRILRLTGEDLHRTFGWFSRYGTWAVFLCRFVPLIRSLISIPAGTVRMKLVPFLLLTTLGSLIWNAALISLGAAVGASWETIVHYMDVYSNFIYGLLLVLFVLFAILHIRKRKGIRPE
jgi:membrane protein DedA with SNARE-associated domain